MRQRLRDAEHRAAFASKQGLSHRAVALVRAREMLQRSASSSLQARAARLDAAALRLSLLDPALVLARGYAWLTDLDGRGVGSVHMVQPGQELRAQLRDGRLSIQTIGVEAK
jgi:exodeoxyribonuclease VII large subunit